MMIGFAHNLLRNAFSLQKGHNFSSLVWDDELAELAQRWADQCPESGHNDECRSLNKFRTVVYQNVGKKSYPGSLPGQKAAEDIPKLMSDIATEWYQQPHNPLKPDTERFETINVVGCGLTKTSRCSLRGHPLPACVDYFTIHLVCNYASKEDESKVEYDTVSF
ncbi:venom allergen 5-like [Nasonia vitripennis]|uniref:SCP domain-containing protein n=1 Tax=Nasonia vitripennis TaxID=7425 RepID=A0A7M7QGR7_NASVI|nr:venom allergen 5-like [Nasonia vitripennis]